MNVLVIDDEPSMVAPIINGLKRRKRKLNWDYYAPNKTNLSDIKKDLADNLKIKPDIVLLDLMMSDVRGGNKDEPNGLKLLDDIKRSQIANINAYVKVIVVSGTLDLDKIYETHGQYIYRVIAKPADMNDLFELLETIAKEEV